MLSLLLIDQTKNFERFVKDFQLSNEIKNRLNNLQSQFTFKTADKIEKIENLKKSVLKYGVPSVIDFIHFQYLINEKYDYSMYEKNYKTIKEITSPKFEFDVLPRHKLPCIVLAVYDMVSTSDLNKQTVFFKRV